MSVEQLTPRKLAKLFGGSERWWTRWLPELYKIGKVGKRGRLYFGNPHAIAEWLACTENTQKRHTEQ